MRKVARVAVILVLAGMAGWAGLSWFAGRYVTVERLVEEAEGEINSRVQIGAVEVTLFQAPAKIVLRDVILAPRDGEQARPYGERTPLAGGPVEVKEVRLAVSLAQLLRRRIAVREFAFEEPRVAMILDENGDNSLDELLRSPESEERAAVATARGGGESLNVHEHGFLAHLDGVRSRGGEVDLEIAKTKLRVTLRDLDVRLDAIEVDPAALENTNTARLEIAGRVEFKSSEKDVQYARLDLDGPARVRLFNPVTGDLEPEVSADLALGDESYLNAEIPAVQKAWKGIQLLDKLGIEVGDLPPRAEFGRSRSIAVHYHDDRFRLEKPISVWFGDWELAVLEGTWVQTETDQHAAGAEVLASEKLSAELRAKLGEGLAKVPREIRPEVAAVLEERLFRDGRLFTDIASAGELSDPDVTVLNKVTDLGEIAKEAAARLSRGQFDRFAEGLLDKLRGDD